MALATVWTLLTAGRPDASSDGTGASAAATCWPTLEAHGQHGLARKVAEQDVIASDPRMSDDARSFAYFANLYERPTAVFLVVSED
jgi:hypothetical protein